jgi:peptide/nickel transport system substrate-binding protein
MKKKKKMQSVSGRWVLWTAAAIGCLTLVACGHGSDGPGSAPAAADRPRTVRALMSHDPPSLSLIGKIDRNSAILAAQLTDALVQYDERMVLEPRLAESYEFSEDRLTLSFRLRPGVRWHDGAEVTSADVVFSVEQVRDPVVENRTFAALFRDLVSLEAVDAHTVRARYSQARPDAIEAWRLPIIPRHRAESGSALLTGEFARHPVGCGPFRFVRYRSGEEIVLEANDDYWDGRPAIDRLVFRIYPDQRTGFQALLAGELDIMVVTPDLWLEARESDAAERLDDFTYYRLNLWHVGWNQDGSNPFFTDPRVRRAMLLALDRETFIATVAHGLARPAVTSYHPDLVWTDPTIAPLPYDPDEARRLLKAAGWTDSDGDGVRDQGGRPFRFTLTIHASTQGINDQMAAWQQQSWAEIGIEAEIEKLEWNQFRERRNAHGFQAAMAGISFTPGPDQFELYHSTERDGGFNHVGLADPEVDRLLELGRSTWDPAERRRIYFRLQRRLHELQPIGCLLHFATPVLHDARLEGIVPSPLDYWRTTRGPRVWRWVPEDTGG